MAEHKDHRRSTEGKAAVSIAAQAYIGQVLDQRYVIEAPLGEGSTGIVYRARHAVLDKPFAVKILRRHLCANATAIQRFRQEAMITAWIGSPHIVDMMDFGTLPDGSTYCVMEYLEGMSLAEAVAQAGRMPVERVLHIARQLLQGLAAAHDNGVIHRDLKSENIFLTQLPDQDEGVKILDFGIAKIGNQTSGMTQNGQIFGTPHYMSPEQCSGLPVDARTDIYAFGIILYEMLSGDVPFDSSSVAELLHRQLHVAPTSFKALLPPVDVPWGLEMIVQRCLEKKADRRFQTVGQLQQELARVRVDSAPEGLLEGVDFVESSYSRVQVIGKSRRVSGSMKGRGPRREPKSGARASRAASRATGGHLGRSSSRRGHRRPGWRWALAAVALLAACAVLSLQLDLLDLRLPTAWRGHTDMAPTRHDVWLASEPTGAEVWRGDVLLGNTPLALPATSRTAALRLSVRKAGFVQRELVITPQTQARVTVGLEALP